MTLKKRNILILFLLNSFFGFSQDLIFSYCVSEDQDVLNIDLEQLQEEAINTYSDVFSNDQAVYITESYSGIIKITQLSDNPQVDVVCQNVDNVTAYKEIAINSQNEIYISSDNTLGSQLLRIDDMCVAHPINNNYSATIHAMSFDKSDNLYMSSSNGPSTIYRADADDLSNLYEWHTFSNGNASGDFVEKNGSLFVAWNVNNTDYLYKVNVDDDNQYVSHENLGPIRNNTFGMANEYGVLYGVTPTSLYRIDENTMQMNTVLNNPSNSYQKRWWGAAGLHEAIEQDYEFFESEAEAESGINVLSSPYALSTQSSHTLYVKITNTTTGAYVIYPIQINIQTPPEIDIPASVTLCQGESYMIDTQLNTDDYTFEWFQDDSFLIEDSGNTLALSESGNYRVIVTPISFDCSNEASVEVTFSETEIQTVEISENSAEVIALGTNPPFSYSVDGVNWQEDSTFNNLSTGTHSFFARNSEGCLSEVFYISIGDSNAITPNGDGINDVYYFPYLQDYTEAYIKIYDRYGKALVNRPLQINDYWDGYFNGRALPTDSYWYQITQKGEILYQSYIFIKNYSDFRRN